MFGSLIVPPFDSFKKFYTNKWKDINLAEFLKDDITLIYVFLAFIHEIIFFPLAKLIKCTRGFSSFPLALHFGKWLCFFSFDLLKSETFTSYHRLLVDIFRGETYKNRLKATRQFIGAHSDEILDSKAKMAFVSVCVCVWMSKKIYVLYLRISAWIFIS